MYLIKYFLFGLIFLSSLGELLHLPFGSSLAIYLSEIILVLDILLLIIWQSIASYKIIIPRYFLIIVCFEIIALLSLIFSLQFFSSREVIVGSLYLIKLIMYSLLLILAFNLKMAKVLTDQEIINIFILNGIILGILGAIQLLLLPNFESNLILLTNFGFDPHQGRLASTFLDPNFTGAYLVLTGGLILYRFLSSQKIIWLFLDIIIIISIILTYSRSAYLMLTIFLIYLTVLLWKKINWKIKSLGLIAILLIILGVGIIFPRFFTRIQGGLILDQSAGQRLESWQTGWTIFQKSPLMGIGYNNLQIAKEKWSLNLIHTTDSDHSASGLDSSFLIVLATTGVAGGLFFILFWLKAIKLFLNKKSLLGYLMVGMVIALLVDSQFINSLFFSPIMIWYFTLMGVLLEDQTYG